MAFNFADSFDLYATANDLHLNYWDANSSATGNLVAGRFAGSQALSLGGATAFIKTSGVNDNVHHIIFDFLQSVNLPTDPAQSHIGLYFTLFDGTTAQCSVGMHGDGTMWLISGASVLDPGAGIVLAKYTGAFTNPNIWYQYEVEIVISNTNGSFTVRKNGNNLNDFVATGLDTQNSPNAYANKIQMGANSSSHCVDDFFWQSSTATGKWFGDIRCFTRMPITDVQKQFSQVSPTLSSPVSGHFGDLNINPNDARALQFVAPYTGNLVGGSFLTTSTTVGHFSLALYDATRATLLGTSDQVTNITPGPPYSGTTTTEGTVFFTFSTSVPVVAGQTYWIAHNQDIAFNIQQEANISFGGVVVNQATPYASWPPASIANWNINNAINFPYFLLTYGSLANCSFVNETPQDAYYSYVWDNHPGDADLYTIGSIPVTPAVVYAVTVRAFGIKSDAGTRTVQVQLKSGGTTVASPTVVLTTSNWFWIWRMDMTDPNTGNAWVPGAVNGLQIGPKVIA